MRRVSDKRRNRNAEAKPIRDGLIAQVGTCEICGSDHLRRYPAELRQLCCHEIANGPNRDKALDKPYALLVLCWYCNSYEVVNKQSWPQARQLATLAKSRPNDYDLGAFNFLVNPKAMNRITADEVGEHLEMYLRVSDIAAHFVVNEKVCKWLESGELVGINLAMKGARRANWRIEPKELQAFIERQRNKQSTVPDTPIKDLLSRVPKNKNKKIL